MNIIPADVGINKERALRWAVPCFDHWTYGAILSWNLFSSENANFLHVIFISHTLKLFNRYTMWINHHF